MLYWKKKLKEVADNPNYIEQNIKAIQKELKKQHPDTAYMRQKVRNIELWLGEIDKFASFGVRKRVESIA